jgi:hypothetical protein
MSEYNFYVDENGVSEFPLCALQKFIILVEEMALKMHGKRNGNMNVAAAWRMSFPIDVDRLERSIEKVINENDALRLIFLKKDEEYLQKVIAHYDNFKLKVTEPQGKTEKDRLEYATKHIINVAEQEIDYYNEIGVRFELVKLSDNDFIFVIVGHHWIGDGSTMALMIDSILRYYKDMNAEKPAAASFMEYIKYEDEFVKSERGQKQLEYWRDELKGYKKFDLTKASVGRRATKEDQSASLNLEAFSKIASGYNTSIFNVVLLAYHIAISKFFGVSDTVIGFSVANRTKKEFLKTIGYLSRAVQHRMIINDSDKLADLLAVSKAKFSTNLANQQTAHYNEGSQFYITYANFIGSKEASSNADISGITPYELPIDRVLTFFTLAGIERETELTLNFIGDPQLFCADFIEAFRKYLPSVIDVLNDSGNNTVADVQKRFETR